MYDPMKRNLQQDTMSEEISVLDYLRLRFKRENWGKEILPSGDVVSPSDMSPTDAEVPDADDGLSWQARFGSWIDNQFDWARETDNVFARWLFFAAAACALAAQLMLEPEAVGLIRNGVVGALLYGLSALCLVTGAVFRFLSRKKSEVDETDTADASEFITIDSAASSETDAVLENVRVPELELDEARTSDKADEPETTSSPVELPLDKVKAALAFAVTAFAFVLFSGNQFNFLNVGVWLIAIGLSAAVVLGSPNFEAWRKAGRLVFSRLNPIRINVTPFALLWTFVFSVSVFLRIRSLALVPTDMFSDHAEKLYDVTDILKGQSPIFFVRNTGREAFQFYWTVLMIRIFGTGVSFLSLKIGTALAGILTLPFTNAVGKRFGGRWVGLLSMLILGVSYWQNVIARVALRFAFYPMFFAPLLYFLFKGLETRKKIWMMLAGLVMGLGLQGYSAYRIVPLLAGVIALIAIATDRKERRGETLRLFGVMAWFMVLGVLPLLNVALTHPEWVWYRSFSRLDMAAAVESAPAWIVFFSNTWKALIMPFWSNGQIWVHSVPYRPAFDVLTAAFYFIGVILLFIRAVRKREFQVIALLVSIPVLLLPSILSIAFPAENPSLNRTGAAAIPMAIAAAYGFYELWLKLIATLRRQVRALAVAMAVMILVLTQLYAANRDLVFNNWQRNYTANAWNTKKIGGVIHGFDQSIGNQANAYVVPFPHWVDTRLVGIAGGFPERDFALQRTEIANFAEPQAENRPLLFIVKDTDVETDVELRRVFPNIEMQLYQGTAPGKDFRVYFVP